MTEELYAKTFYSPKGYWKSEKAVIKLAEKTKTSQASARKWLTKQAIWQVYLPKPSYIPRPMFDENIPNAIHQADLLYLPHDTVRVGRRTYTYKYALNIVDIASRYKESEPLTDKTSVSVAAALSVVYARGPLTWPIKLQVDPGTEFQGQVNVLLAKHHVQVRRGQPNNHRQQGLVENYNKVLAERLFGAQYAQEMLFEARGSHERSTVWVKDLSEVVQAINDEPTRLTGLAPTEAIKQKNIKAKHSLPAPSGRIVGLEEPILSGATRVRYLYAPGEEEGGTHRRATDPIWSLSEYIILEVIREVGEPALYYLDDGPQRSFVREELQVVPIDTELPPDSVL